MRRDKIPIYIIRRPSASLHGERFEFMLRDAVWHAYDAANAHLH